MSDPDITTQQTIASRDNRADGQTGNDPAHKLQSLAATFQADQHGNYVAHLEAAVSDPKNRNIALTGRYGTGKSSVLDKFEEKHRDRTLRVSITTLGPDRDDEGLTNRIQKELVKQLIYRTKPADLRSSRFARTDPLNPWKALGQAAAAVAVVLPLLMLTGWLPHIAGTAHQETTSTRIAAWLLFVVLTTLAAWAARMALGSRIITGLSTAGASITLKEREDTYFDAYLDELVTYFDGGREDYVIFEDLDRFDDPEIFDSLRELNTILNASPRRVKKSDKRQLCFIYAIKDSLFERLGETESADTDGSSDAPDDKAMSHQEVTAIQPSAFGEDPSRAVRGSMAERANRTKFFDVVIPMVPFLSHRNARDVLDHEMRKRDVPEGTVSRGLLSLVARHTTDMRLMLNILNEFVVYAEHLLWVKKPAPEITGDRLFALVAYKNFHLADFEAVPARESTLDSLDQKHRQMVRAAVSARQAQKSAAADHVARQRNTSPVADRLGRMVVAAANLAVKPSYPKHAIALHVGNDTFTADTARTPLFWQKVAEHQAITVQARDTNDDAITDVVTWNAQELKHAFSDGMDQETWSDTLSQAQEKRIKELDAEIDALRGADYSELAKEEEIKDSDGKTFDEHVEALPSELARELVRSGFINRNFATYSAAFYGTFAGIDAETFYYRSVLPNEMLLDHSFTTPEGISHLLAQVEQTEPDFYGSISALNPQIVTYLLDQWPARGREVASFLASHFDANAQEFMTAYLAEDKAPHGKLVQALTAHPWVEIFNYLVSDDVPEHLKATLVDAALLTAVTESDFHLNDSAREFIATNFGELTAFTEPQDEPRPATVLGFAQRASMLVEDLNDVAKPLRDLLVEHHMYALTAHNLRVALDGDGAVPLDQVAENPDVAAYCHDKIDDYLSAIAEDDATPHSVEAPATLQSLLSEKYEEWTAEQLEAVLASSSPNSALNDLGRITQECWTLLAKYRRFTLTVPNLQAYTAQFNVDAPLAKHLVSEGARIHVSDDTSEDQEPRLALALTLLNAHDQLSAPDRTRLTTDLGIGPGDLQVDQITPVADDLLAEALDRNLVEPSEATFTHFLGAGWAAVSTAVKRHEQLRPFVTPDRVSGAAVRELLDDDDGDAQVQQAVLENFDEFVPPTASAELHRAAAIRGAKLSTSLAIPQISRIADHVPDADLVLPLLAQHDGLDGDQLVSVLVKLGAPYDQLQTPERQFALPEGEAALKVFRRLEATEKVRLSSSRKEGEQVHVR
ncbi:hypothetical protein [Marmoricola sp. URHB0036]|uniref:YobI family P-loop NTPase n=1 Tax=Marmoricola sp. URHB0036 TaxID=1298863 RepID=UPI0004231A2A|nr:hypothetical protein [Marmoricola sp. URHB0036]